LRISFKNGSYWLIPVVLLFIIANAILIYKNQYWLNIVPLVLMIVYLSIFSLDVLMFIIITLVPLSVPLSELMYGLKFDMFLPTEPIIAGLMLLFFIKVIHDEYFDKRILRHPVTYAIILNLGWIFITCFTSTMPAVSFKFFLSRLWFVVVFYFIATQLFTKYGNIRKYIWFYSFSLVIVVIYFVLRLYPLGLSDQKAANWVVRPFYNDHTAYAAALSMIIPCLTGLLVIKRKASLPFKLFLLLLIIFFLGALALSYTRAAWASLAVAVSFFIGLRLKIRLKIMFLSIGILIGLFFLVKTEILISLERNKQESSNSIAKHLKSISNINTDASNKERINRWSCALRMFRDKPIFGFGPGTYMFKYAPYQLKREETIISTNAGTLGNAHSEYLGPLSESGLLGTLTFAGILFATLTTASNLYFKGKRRKIRLMALTLVVALLTYYIHGFLNNFLDTDKLSALFWGFTAMIVALDVYHNKKKKEKEKTYRENTLKKTAPQEL
jgi:putative inorganic carbon (hco3(-)) transporter